MGGAPTFTALRHRAAPAAATLGVLVLVTGLAACGSSARARTGASTGAVSPPEPTAGRTTAAPAPTGTAATCAATVTDTLGRVAERVYQEAASGRILAQALHRVQSSTALADAVSRNDAAATRATASSLLLSQIVRLRVLRGSRVLTDVGRSAVLAPAAGVIRDAAGNTVGRFVLSVQDDGAYLAIVHRITGAEVLLRQGGRQVAGTLTPGPHTVSTRGGVTYRGVSYQAFSFVGQAFPSGPMHVSLLAGPSSLAGCANGGTQNVAATLGQVAKRIYDEEASSLDVRSAVRYVAGSRAFQQAVSQGDPAAAHAAIVGFFSNHNHHIVRVRVTRGAQVLTDVGGPYVLAPVGGTLRGAGGQTIGHFLLAIQDDLGYILLTHRFTGAEVILRVAGQLVPGSTLSPAPTNLPDHGLVTYRGQGYQAFSFTGVAFPSGPLRISVLIPG